MKIQRNNNINSLNIRFHNLFIPIHNNDYQNYLLDKIIIIMINIGGTSFYYVYNITIFCIYCSTPRKISFAFKLLYGLIF